MCHKYCATISILLMLSVVANNVVAQQDEGLASPVNLALLEPDRFNAAFAGVTKVDFKQVRHDLLAMQELLEQLSEQQWVYYHFYRALRAHNRE